MASVGNSVTKSHSSLKLSSTLQDIKTVILLEKFSVDLNYFTNLSTTFFIQRFLTFLFSIKIAFSKFFILGVKVFLHLRFTVCRAYLYKLTSKCIHSNVYALSLISLEVCSELEPW